MVKEIPPGSGAPARRPRPSCGGRNSMVRWASARASSSGVMAGASSVAGWPVMAAKTDAISRRWVWVRPPAGATAEATPRLRAKTSPASGGVRLAWHGLARATGTGGYSATDAWAMPARRKSIQAWVRAGGSAVTSTSPARSTAPNGAFQKAGSPGRSGPQGPT